MPFHNPSAKIKGPYFSTTTYFGFLVTRKDGAQGVFLQVVDVPRFKFAVTFKEIESLFYYDEYGRQANDGARALWDLSIGNIEIPDDRVIIFPIETEKGWEVITVNKIKAAVLGISVGSSIPFCCVFDSGAYLHYDKYGRCNDPDYNIDVPATPPVPKSKPEPSGVEKENATLRDLLQIAEQALQMHITAGAEREKLVDHLKAQLHDWKNLAFEFCMAAPTRPTLAFKDALEHYRRLFAESQKVNVPRGTPGDSKCSECPEGFEFIDKN